LLLALTISGSEDAGERYLTVDVIPFASDRTENFLFMGTKATLTVFFRYKQELTAEYEMEIDRGTAVRLTEALRTKSDAAAGKKDQSTVGRDEIVFCTREKPRSLKPSSIPFALAPSELLAVMTKIRSEGSLGRSVPQRSIRAIPFVPVGEQPPESVTQEVMSKEGWQTITQSIDAPMRFIVLAEGVYRALAAELAEKRQVVAVARAQYFELRLYDIGPAQN
jgi:hypothetical protein